MGPCPELALFSKTTAPYLILRKVQSMLKTSQQPQQDSDKSDGVFSDEKEKQEMEKTGQALVASTGAFGKIHSCLINSICSVNGVLVVEACDIILTMPN